MAYLRQQQKHNLRRGPLGFWMGLFTEQGTTRVRILCVFAAYFHLCAINFPLWPAFMLCVCESCLNALCTGKQTQTVSRKYR